jgi:hypothetical protein
VKNAVNFIDTGGLCGHVHSAATEVVRLGKDVTVRHPGPGSGYILVYHYT